MQKVSLYPFTQSKAATMYFVSRTILFLLTVITLLYIILAAFGYTFYYIFSAATPYVLAWCAYDLCETYNSLSEIPILLIPAVISIIPYVIFIIYSKKHYGWIIASLVYFSLDCIVFLIFPKLILFINIYINLIFHAAVIFFFIIGIKYGRQLKAHPKTPVPAAEPYTPANTAGAEGVNSDYQNSPALRTAENGKQKIHAEADAFGHHIVYLKVKKRDELVVDGMVYGEYIYPSWMMHPHTLTAYIKGVKISAGFAAGKNFIRVNDMEFAKSTRWI